MTLEKVPPSKCCAVCGKSFSKEDVGSAKSFKRRKTCGETCFDKLRAKVQLSHDRAEFVDTWNASSSVKECAEKLDITVQEARSRASNAKLSGIVLKSLKPQIPFSEKTCIVCGDSFKRYEREGATNFRRRQTCSFDCKKVFMSNTRKGYDYAAFSESWNAARSVDECAKQWGITAPEARSRASNVRLSGFVLKRLYHTGKTINIHGVEMTVREFCAMTGLKTNTVLYRLRHGLEIFARPLTRPDLAPPQQGTDESLGTEPSAGESKP